MTVCLVLVALVLGLNSRCIAQDDLAMKVAYRIPLKVHAFDLKDVHLLSGPFRDAMERDEKFLLSLEPERFLHTFKITAGLPSDAKPYGGWEAPDVELRGHSLGHYLSALSLMYASTGNTVLKSRAESIVAELAKIQEAMPSQGYHKGYLSAFPESFFDRVETEKPVWAPYYTIHKIMAGLLDVYLHCGDKQALDVVEKMAGWVKFRMDRLTEEQQQATLKTEYGGMIEVLANLYAVTGNPGYLKTADTFHQKVLFDPLAIGVDPLDGLHANTQFPKIIGVAREYELTGNKRDYDIASFFWDRVALHRSYVIGGNSDNESFFQIRNFSKHLGISTTETCNVYNMLKLTRHLFEWQPSAVEMDYYERGLYNQILASQDPATGMMTYYIPLKPGSFKTFSTPTNSFWCCTGTGMENHAKYGETIYFHNDTSLYVNLFIPSELNWKDKNIRIRQTTRFPENDITQITFECKKPSRFTLEVRYPEWARSGMQVTIDGKAQHFTANPESYVGFNRMWKNGDKVEVRLPMTLHTESMPDDSSMISLLYGPIVLAGDLGNDGIDSALQYGPYTPNLRKLKPITIPAFVCDRSQLLASIKPVAGEALTFRTNGVGRPEDVTLVPFYKMFKDRYTVYWDLYNESGYEKRNAEIAAAKAKREDIERRTVDLVKVGDRANEIEHHMQGDTTSGGVYYGKGWRESRGGWFSYELGIHADKPATLVCSYQGSEEAARVFDVLVDSVNIATQTMENHPTESFDVEYQLPENLTKGKNRITVKFQAKPDAVAGSVLDVRTVQ
jgi:DUF1680 family protein